MQTFALSFLEWNFSESRKISQLIWPLFHVQQIRLAQIRVCVSCHDEAASGKAPKV